ncbi:MAG: tyrosine-type recombinase/integrase [Sphingomonadaceae bacterium]
MDIRAVSEAHALALRAEGRSEHTVSWYRVAVSQLSRFLASRGLTEIEQVRTEHVRAFALWLKDSRSDNPLTGKARSLCDRSVRDRVAAIKGFFAFAAREGYLDRNPLEHYSLPKAEKRVIMPFTEAQVEAMLFGLNLKDRLELRNACILLFLLDTGVRVSELCDLKREDVDLIAGVAKVMGKGRKERVVYFESTTKRLLIRYVYGGAKESQYLFTNRSGEKLSRGAVLDMVGDLARRVGVTGVRASPHTLRHTFAVRYLLAGGDQSSLQVLLGHSSSEMVQRYVHLTKAQVQAQHSRFSPVERLGLGRVVERLNSRRPRPSRP